MGSMCFQKPHNLPLGGGYLLSSNTRDERSEEIGGEEGFGSGWEKEKKWDAVRGAEAYV